jgi:hypothetical protein
MGFNRARLGTEFAGAFRNTGDALGGVTGLRTGAYTARLENPGEIGGGLKSGETGGKAGD